jgi:hypothetical protein
VYLKVPGLAAWSENFKWYSSLSLSLSHYVQLYRYFVRVSLVSFAAIILCVASQRVFIVVLVYVVIGSVWKLFDTPSYSDYGWCLFPSRRRVFLFDTASTPALRPTRPSVQWVPGTLSPGIKRPGRETDHSPPPSAEVENVPSLLHTSSCCDL